jgi:hypothetical protein
MVGIIRHEPINTPSGQYEDHSMIDNMITGGTTKLKVFASNHRVKNFRLEFDIKVGKFLEHFGDNLCDRDLTRSSLLCCAACSGKYYLGADR